MLTLLLNSVNSFVEVVFLLTSSSSSVISVVVHSVRSVQKVLTCKTKVKLCAEELLSCKRIGEQRVIAAICLQQLDEAERCIMVIRQV